MTKHTAELDIACSFVPLVRTVLSDWCFLLLSLPESVLSEGDLDLHVVDLPMYINIDYPDS